VPGAPRRAANVAVVPSASRALLSRRSALIAAGAAAFARPAWAARAGESIAALERRYGGRLGVFALDLGSGRRIEHRAGERFLMCSTFKLLAVGATLSRVEHGHDDLKRRIAFTSCDLLHYAPSTRTHMRADGMGTMTLEQTCAAAIEWSDNTAANLLLRELGGPPRVTAFARTIGDERTRLDRNEPSLNSAVSGDPRDTTTPASMAAAWMLACRTGETRIQAGVPATWRCGSKTGSGDYATANDVVFLIPPGRPPIVVAAYYTGSHADDDQQDAVIAAVGRIVAEHIG
jgi:beta-lactamase class A